MSDEQLPRSAIYGKKIFFLCATFTLNTNVILRLLEQEFEVYKLDQYRQLKSLLQLNPDSIVYINIDSQNTPNVWFNFISYFEHNPEFKDVKFGVFSQKFKLGDKERFSKALKLEAGLYAIDNNFGAIMGEIMQKLDTLKAKGMRKFVRMNCMGLKNCDAYYVSGNMMYKMTLIDISSIGMGVRISAKHAHFFSPNTVLQGFNLVLASKQMRVNVKISGVKPERDGVLIVMIFMPDTEDIFRSYIRTFICEELQKKLFDEAIQLPPDRTDYTQEVEIESDVVAVEEPQSVAQQEENSSQIETENTNSNGEQDEKEKKSEQSDSQKVEDTSETLEEIEEIDEIKEIEEAEDAE